MPDDIPDDLEKRVKERIAEAQKKRLFDKVQAIAMYLGEHNEHTSHDDGIPIYRKEAWELQRGDISLIFYREGWLDNNDQLQKGMEDLRAAVNFGGKVVFYQRKGLPSEPGEKTGVIAYNPGTWEAKIEELHVEYQKTVKADKIARKEATAQNTRMGLARVASENFGLQ